MRWTVLGRRVTASVGLIKAQGGGWENPRQEVQQGLESESKKKMTLQTYQLAYARGDRQLFRDLNFEMHAGNCSAIYAACAKTFIGICSIAAMPAASRTT